MKTFLKRLYLKTKYTDWLVHKHRTIFSRRPQKNSLLSTYLMKDQSNFYDAYKRSVKLRGLKDFPINKPFIHSYSTI